MEQLFLNWVRRTGRERDLFDYDMRGAFSKDAKLTANGHLPDTFKKPNHPTFSSESTYSNDQMPGGVWSQNEKGGWAFAPSPYNLQFHGAEGLQQYFKEREPDAVLQLPTMK